MLKLGRWQIVRESNASHKKVGYWINTLYSPFVRFSETVKEFLDSKDDPDKFQNFTNSWLAEPWEDTKLKTSADTVMERQTKLPALYGTTQWDVVRMDMVSIPTAFSVSQKWLKLLTGFKQKEKLTVDYFDTETLEIKRTEMFISGYRASLVKDTSYKGLWKVSFTLKEF